MTSANPNLAKHIDHFEIINDVANSGAPKIGFVVHDSDVSEKLHKVSAFLSGNVAFAVKGRIRMIDECEDLEITAGDTSLGTFKNFDTEAFLAAASPAAFGDLKNGGTIVDPSVRNALDMSDIEIEGVGSCYAIALDRIGDILNATFCSVGKINIHPYKINYYGPGGHFKKHVDTPRSESDFGTLVMVVPHPHEGGKFRVTDPAGAHSMELDSASDSTTNTDFVHWIAFYGNCPHEIEPVTAGARITVTFNLRFRDMPPRITQNPVTYAVPERMRTEAGFEHRLFLSESVTLAPLTEPPAGVDASCLAEFRSFIDDMLRKAGRNQIEAVNDFDDDDYDDESEEEDTDEDESESAGLATPMSDHDCGYTDEEIARPAGKMIGIGLIHTYTRDFIRTGTLNNGDFHIVEFLKRYYTCKLLPVVVHTSYTQEYEGKREYDIETGVYALTDHVLSRIENGLNVPTNFDHLETTMHNVPFIMNGMCAKYVVHYSYQPPAEYTGNESESGTSTFVRFMTMVVVSPKE